MPLEKSEVMVEAVKERGGDARLTIYPEAGHNAWDPAYSDPELYEWFLRHRRQKNGKVSIQEPISLKEELREFLYFRHCQYIHAFTDIEVTGAGNEVDFSLEIENPLTVDLDIQIEWEKVRTSSWIITSVPEQLLIRPGGKGLFRFKAHVSEEENFFPLRQCKVKFAAAERNGEIRLSLPIDVDAHLRKHRPTLVAKQIASPPTIDGKLDDIIWQRGADVFDFVSMDIVHSPSVRTEAWVAYDDKYYYVAMRCHEPFPDMLKTSTTERDGQVWNDDSVEIFLDTNRDRKTYYQFIVNANGVLYDAFGYDKSFDCSVQVAVTRDESAWTIELAIPWADVKVAPPIKMAKMGFLLVRTRKAKQEEAAEVLQYPPVNGGNHRKEYFGNLNLK